MQHALLKYIYRNNMKLQHTDAFTTIPCISVNFTPWFILFSSAECETVKSCVCFLYQPCHFFFLPLCFSCALSLALFFFFSSLFSAAHHLWPSLAISYLLPPLRKWHSSVKRNLDCPCAVWVCMSRACCCTLYRFWRSCPIICINWL